MVKFCHYRPTLLFCITVFVSLMIIIGYNEPDTISRSEKIALTTLKILQFTILICTFRLEWTIHCNQKRRYYSQVRHFQFQLQRLQLWESEKFTPQIILNRYYLVFSYFEDGLKTTNKTMCKKYAVKLEAIQGEYNRLKDVVNLTHDDLHDFKLSVKTLLF